MITSSSALGRLNLRDRMPALLGLVALALMQVSFATHQFQHADDHGLTTVCYTCSMYQQLEDTPVSCALATEQPITADSLAAATADPFIPAAIAETYRSRAPPRS